MWHKETVSAACVDMAHHYEEACMLQVHVRIGVYYRVIACFHICRSIVLNGELTECRAIVGCVVFCEKARVGSEVDCKHLGDLEVQVEVCVDIEHRYGQNILVA